MLAHSSKCLYAGAVMRTRGINHEAPLIPPEPTLFGFFRMSEWILNTCQTLYRDRKESAPHHLAFYEFDTPLWLHASVKPVSLIPKKANENRKRIPKLTVLSFEAFIRDDATEFNVWVPEISSLDEDEQEKQKQLLLENFDAIDGYSVMRDYCLNQHVPTEPSQREMSTIDFDMLMNSGPLTS